MRKRICVKAVVCSLVILGRLTMLADGYQVPLASGIASWYGEELRGRPTASGAPFNPDKFTCASWYYPFGTKLRVTATDSGRSVVVLVNDRGPNKRLGRAIDLSESAFAKIADKKGGLVKVTILEVK